jgi:DNA-binding NarL/FixJ family response regulator
MTKRQKDDEAISAIALSVATTAFKNTAILATQMQNEKKRTDAITTATFETLSRRQRPVFVQELRKQGYSQEEVGGMVSRSQSAISKYEKSFKKQNEK